MKAERFYRNCTEGVVEEWGYRVEIDGLVFFVWENFAGVLATDGQFVHARWFTTEESTGFNIRSAIGRTRSEAMRNLRKAIRKQTPEDVKRRCVAVLKRDSRWRRAVAKLRKAEAAEARSARE